MTSLSCRHCGAPLQHTVIDLGHQPPSNAYLRPEQLGLPEITYPLQVFLCGNCWLVQLPAHAEAAELFTADYAYFSSISSSWCAHAERFVAAMVERLDLRPESLVVELASNDGYLLQYVQKRGIRCLGIEPTHATAEAARAKGITTIERFFGVSLAEELAQKNQQADLIVANNVLAHVPNINDFVSGFTRLLKPHGVATFEFPYLLHMVEGNQFDTIYHEHYSYLSITAAHRIFASCGLNIFDVEQLPTHGGSLRVFAQRADTATRAIAPAISTVLKAEANAGITTTDFYQTFQQQAEQIREEFLKLLIDAREQGLRVGAYGAAAKGNTLLNFARVTHELLPYVVDRCTSKLGKFMPGSHIPIVSEDHLRAHKPQLIVLLPWNLRQELATQLFYTAEWGAELVVAVPRLERFTPGENYA